MNAKQIVIVSVFSSLFILGFPLVAPIYADWLMNIFGWGYWSGVVFSATITATVAALACGGIELCERVR